MNCEVVEENYVTWFGDDWSRIFNWILLEDQSVGVAIGLVKATQFMRSWIHTQTAHFVGGVANMNDSGHHRILDAREVIPVLVHRKWRPLFSRFLE